MKGMKDSEGKSGRECFSLTSFRSVAKIEQKGISLIRILVVLFATIMDV
ncbi:hypothetical protein Desor_5549 [Desulfosporosinus orientis DSM 765]|uniref:Uncharacterized protein n=1 Tax=Desulfosporosinus orientis (strain ATCC 19365 / DSM 765 / NCIMB 8382 / VKM B-1628 / Singapore I) TaxID=768706 RepID=G7WHK2_DESOD|nr:hypothetical protein Desor_5549 [Desulfosporosinus orientis DSM 765]